LGPQFKSLCAASTAWRQGFVLPPPATQRILSRQTRLGETSGREHVEREMRAPVVIVVEKNIGVVLGELQFIDPELECAKLLTPQRTVEGFNESLFVLLVSSRDTMLIRPAMHALSALGFEL